MTMPLIGFVIIPIIMGLFIYIKDHQISKLMMLSLQFMMLLFCISYIVKLQTRPEILEYLSVYELPAGMTLKLDKLSMVTMFLNNLLFLLMIAFNYHKEYINKLFIFLFLSLQGINNGIFLANDFFNVYILIEIATVIVSILIMFKKDSQSMYDGMIYLMANLTAMSFFLLGVGYIYKNFGVLDFNSVQEMILRFKDQKGLIMPYAFLLTGVSLKAALMPLFSWLPKAHATASAPSIVSSILSGIFIKIGVYLFIRLIVIFNPAIDVSKYFLVMGAITSIAGFTFAIAQKNIKLILAYHTISQIGLIMIGLNIGSESAFNGAIYHILTHGIFKALLFLNAGICVEMYNTREISKMNGLWHHSKVVSISLIIAVLSITGAPFMSGGYSKYLISYSSKSAWGFVLFQFISMGTMISFIKFFKMIFSKPDDNAIKAAAKSEKAVVAVMAIFCVLLGVFGDYFAGILLNYNSYFPIYKQVAKLSSYFVTYGIGYGVYKIIIEDRKWIKYVRGIDLTFNNISIAIVSFFTMTLVYLNMVYI